MDVDRFELLQDPMDAFDTPLLRRRKKLDQPRLTMSNEQPQNVYRGIFEVGAHLDSGDDLEPVVGKLGRHLTSRVDPIHRIVVGHCERGNLLLDRLLDKFFGAEPPVRSRSMSV